MKITQEQPKPIKKTYLEIAKKNINKLLNKKPIDNKNYDKENYPKISKNINKFSYNLNTKNNKINNKSCHNLYVYYLYIYNYIYIYNKKKIGINGLFNINKCIDKEAAPAAQKPALLKVEKNPIKPKPAANEDIIMFDSDNENANANADAGGLYFVD